MKIRIKDFREYANITQKDLATLLNVSQAAISAYELGTRQPDFETLEKIANIFKVPIDALFDRDKKDLFIITRENYEALLKVRDVINDIELINGKKDK